MVTNIYINNDRIRIIDKSAKKEEAKTFLLKEGTVLNGVIVDANEIVEKLTLISKDITKAVLIINSSNISIKRITTPRIPKNKLQSIVAREFDVGQDQEYIFDTNVLKRGEEQDVILCCAVARDFIQKYIDIFKEANIKLDRIDVVVNSIVKYVNRNEELKGETFVFNVISDDGILSLLFEDGIYRLTNRSRMFSELGDPGYIGELYAKLSTMVQFGKSQKLEAVIDKSYYVGLSDDVLEQLDEFAKQYANPISILAHNHEGTKQEYFYPSICDLENKEDINLRNYAKHIKRDVKKIGSNHLKVGILLGSVALVLLSTLYFKVQYDAVDKEVAALQQEIINYENSSELIQQQEIIDKNDIVLSEIQQYMLVDYTVTNGTYLTKDMLEAIYSENVSINSISYTSQNGSLLIGGESSTKEGAALYSQELRELGFSDTQLYSGYSLTGDSTYTFTIQASWDTSEEGTTND